MLFNSAEFIFLFLPLTLLVFFQIGGRGNYQFAMLWLVAASLFFYSLWNPVYVWLLIFSIIFNYVLATVLSRCLAGSIQQRWLLSFGIGVNLALLAYFKYANFFSTTVNDLLGTSYHLNKIILPLGISFFTFVQIAYLVDTSQKETQKNSFLSYCLFVSFFPKLIAGPITRYKEILPQLTDKSIYQFKTENIAMGLTTFSLGLFKKVAIADGIASFATPVFDAAASGVSLTFYEAWGGALAYSLQLYFDFSGYSDMAIGVARMFGIQLPLNFDSPYKAVNIIDFWRRWHMTFSFFLRDYLYIPLGGNRKGKVRRYINLMVTMLLGGLWHGAGWTFVVWGGLHGIYLVINHQWHSFLQRLGHDLKKIPWWSRGLGLIVTFIAVVIAWVFFRADNMATAVTMLKAMIGINGMSTSAPVVPQAKLILLSLSLFVWFFPNTQEWMSQDGPSLTKPVVEMTSNWRTYLWQRFQWQPNTAFGAVIGVLTFIGVKLFLEAPKSDFAYFHF